MKSLGDSNHGESAQKREQARVFLRKGHRKCPTANVGGVEAEDRKSGEETLILP